MATFVTNYMDDAVLRLGDVVERAHRDLNDVDFDTLVGTGFSGGFVIPTLALAMDKKFLLVRKENDDSHHGGGRLVGEIGERWIFVDDFVGRGGTIQRVKHKVATTDTGWLNDYARVETTYVGAYLYRDFDQTFHPADPDHERECRTCQRSRPA